jgi:hypothetical protein
MPEIQICLNVNQNGSVMLCTPSSSLARFQGQLIGRKGPVEWASRSPDLNPLDYAFWGNAKLQVYSVILLV